MSDPLADKIRLLIADLAGLGPEGQLRVIRAFLDQERGLDQTTMYLDPYDLNLVRDYAARSLQDSGFKSEVLQETFTDNPDLHRTAAFFDASSRYLKARGLLLRDVGFRKRDHYAKPCAHAQPAASSTPGSWVCAQCGAAIAPVLWAPK